MNRISKQPRYTQGTFTVSGKKVSFPDASSFAFIYHEIFIKEIYKFKTLNPTPLIIDCGANIGIGVLYFKKEFPSARIIAFEPEKKIFEFLQDNIKSAKLEGVQLEEKALWSHNDTIYFSNEGADGSRIAEFGTTEASFTATYPVEAVKLSAYIKEPVDFLKIDIEGAEVEVIKEIEFMLHQVQRIFIEYHSFYNRKQELDVVLSILERNGFRYYINAPSDIRQYPFIEDSKFMSFDNYINIYATRH